MDELKNNNNDFGCCDPCPEDNPLQPINVDCNSCCDGIQINCIENMIDAKCVPILTQNIFDCIVVEDELFKFARDLTFTITTTETYVTGDHICLTDYAVNYEFIGLTDSTLTTQIDSIDVPFLPTNDSMYVCNTVTLYDSYEGSLNTNKYCCEIPPKTGVKVRIFEEDLDFYICGLKITIAGKIGCACFKADFEYSGPLSALNFKTIDLCGRICIPTGARKVTLYEEFDSCLDVGCITPRTSVYDGTNEIIASADLTLQVAKTIYSTIKEKLVVFTTPDGLICTPSTCKKDCYKPDHRPDCR